MFVAQAVGSVFNITYNLVHISPLLSEAQKGSFQQSINLYNLIAYPALVLIWFFAIFRLRKIESDPEKLLRQQQRVINLPWIASLVAAAGWLFCIPALVIGLQLSEETIDPHVYFHFPVSVVIAMIIALAVGYFLIDWLRQVLLFPLYFDQISPSRIKGGHGLSISGRGILWTFAASICPIIALLLLLISPAPDSRNLNFALMVAAFGVFSAIISAALMSRLIVHPVDQLRMAAQEVGKGNIDVVVDNLRADEFGILADEFNAMVAGLREKERVENTFGRHVGKEIARRLLQAKEDLEGVEREISILFADIRGFTTRCETLSPKEAVLLLNEYHATMTEVIENNGGMVNQLIGDGMMAIFGVADDKGDFANNAVSAGRQMLQGMAPLNRKLRGLGFDPIKIGVGINTGPTVVGTIGSPRRMEYTAIGDAVNTAARIEGMTKDLGSPLLVSESTWNALSPKPKGTRLDPQEVRGRRNEIILFAVDVE